jgi:glycerol uptake facilitator-like aquaporin
VLAVAEGSKVVGSNAALATGFSVLINTLTFGPVSRVAMNPFRALGPAIVNVQALRTIWPYIVGPFIASLCAILIMRVFTTQRVTEEATEKAKGSAAVNPNV